MLAVWGRRFRRKLLSRSERATLDDEHATNDQYQREGLDKLIQLFDQLAKAGQRSVNWFGAFHVDAGIAKQVERVLRTTTLEEAEVVLQLAFAAV